MKHELARLLVPRLVFLACVLSAHAATMALLDREDVVGRALGAHQGPSGVVVLGLFAFLLLRVFVWVFLPGFVLFWVADTLASLRTARGSAPVVRPAGDAPGGAPGPSRP